MSETRRTSWTDLINRICPSRDETSLAPEAGNVSVGLNRAVTVSARWVNTNQSPDQTVIPSLCLIIQSHTIRLSGRINSGTETKYMHAVLITNRIVIQNCHCTLLL